MSDCDPDIVIQRPALRSRLRTPETKLLFGADAKGAAPTMSVVSIISAERERYTAHFEAIVAGIVSSGSSHARELLISINNEAIPYPYRYLRVDLIEKAADGSNQLSEVWLDPPHNFEATVFSLARLGSKFTLSHGAQPK